MLKKTAYIVGAAFSFAVLFLGSPLMGWVFFPMLRLFAKDSLTHKINTTQRLKKTIRGFCWMTQVTGMMKADPSGFLLPEVLEPYRPRVWIANHPTLIDVFYFLAYAENTVCDVKPKHYKSFIFHNLLKQTLFVPAGDVDKTDSKFLESSEESVWMAGMMRALEAGYSVIVFPEGTRSPPSGGLHRFRLHRFRRGAFELAAKAKVPLRCFLIKAQGNMLKQKQPFWKVQEPIVCSYHWLCDEEVLDAETSRKAIATLYKSELSSHT